MQGRAEIEHHILPEMRAQLDQAQQEALVLHKKCIGLEAQVAALKAERDRLLEVSQGLKVNLSRLEKVQAYSTAGGERSPMGGAYQTQQLNVAQTLGTLEDRYRPFGSAN